MGRRKSTFVCRRCGLAIHLWTAPGTWKHFAGTGQRSCGQPPIVMSRADYDAEMAALAESARAALRHLRRP